MIQRISSLVSLFRDPGVYIVQNTMARGGGMVPGKKMKNEAVGNKMKKKEKGKGKRGKEMIKINLFFYSCESISNTCFSLLIALDIKVQDQDSFWCLPLTGLARGHSGHVSLD